MEWKKLLAKSQQIDTKQWINRDVRETLTLQRSTRLSAFSSSNRTTSALFIAGVDWDRDAMLPEDTDDEPCCRTNELYLQTIHQRDNSASYPQWILLWERDIETPCCPRTQMMNPGAEPTNYTCIQYTSETTQPPIHSGERERERERERE